MTSFPLNQWRCSSLRPIWAPGMDKLITLQQLLRNYLKLNVHYVVALKDFTISATSFNDALFLNLITRCTYRQQHEQACPIITIFLIVTKRHQTMSSPIVNILHHSYITNRKMFLWNICRWKDNVSTWGRLEPPTLGFILNALTIWAIRARHLMAHVWNTGSYCFRWLLGAEQS